MVEFLHIGVGRDYPDAGEGMCCMGAAALGPERCTCWRPIHDQPQQLLKAGPMLQRTRMCGDCAFRPDSPERAGNEDAVEELLEGTFLCHKGMRRLLREVHPSGAVLDAGPGAYEPSNPPCKADGNPAEVCAGWVAEMKRRESAESEQQ